LGLSSFFVSSNADPIAPAMAAQPSLDNERAADVGELRLVFMVTDR
jgi:hypothetical protein